MMTGAVNLTAEKLAAEKKADGADALDPKVVVSRQGAIVALTLNRPQALNAFDDEMRQVFADEIQRAGRNPDIYAVILKSASPKAFCAGGDVRAIVATAARDMALARSYFAGEYSLNWQLDCFSKPVISFINGICMGSGAGLTLFNTHRVAGEGYKFAMPETAIGLFPDVGVAHPLAHLPWPLGLYLGLTGRVIDRADAHWLGLATHCISAAHFPDIMAKVSDSQPIDPILDGLHETQSGGSLQRDKTMIDDLFSPLSLQDILDGLERASGASAEFARATLSDLRKRSPLALAITDKHIRGARTMDLRETLIQDYRLGTRCLAGSDFKEGVRAALIDKDGAPRWQHANVEAVTEDEVASYFAPLGGPLGGEDLSLRLRADMQGTRS
jgi:enoyl-CoA hydratase